MDKKESIISALVSVILGIMLIIMKGRVISIALTVLGATILISAIVDFLNQLTNIGIVKAVVGVCVLVFGWLFVNLALYILAAAIIIMGLMQIADIHKYSPVNLTAGEKFSVYMRPAVTVIAGVCLLFNQGGTINGIFIVAGVLMIMQGVMALVGTNR